MSEIEFPPCPRCGSEEVDIGRHSKYPSIKVYGCWLCGNQWTYTPYKGKVVVLKYIEGQEIPPSERHLSSLFKEESECISAQ